MSLSKEDIKKNAAVRAAEVIEDGMTIGIGTGSTVYWFIHELAKKQQQGLHCQCVPTSAATLQLALQLGISMLALNDVASIDITIDGADEIDPALNLIKGGGGALLQEKMVAAASNRLIIVADHEKLVPQLGAFPLPVEVVPYGWTHVKRRIEARYHIATQLRQKGGAPLLTDHGHFILDCAFKQIAQPEAVRQALNNIPGVVDNGLFMGMAQKAVIGFPDGRVEWIRPKT